MSRKAIVRNKSPHIISFSSGVVLPFKSAELLVSDDELVRYAGLIEVSYLERMVPNSDGDMMPSQSSSRTLNVMTDDYLERNTRTILQSLEEDQEKLSEQDLRLLRLTEENNQKRIKVLNKLKGLIEVRA